MIPRRIIGVHCHRLTLGASLAVTGYFFVISEIFYPMPIKISRNLFMECMMYKDTKQQKNVFI